MKQKDSLTDVELMEQLYRRIYQETVDGALANMTRDEFALITAYKKLLDALAKRAPRAV